MGERGDPRSPRSSLGDGDMPRTITSSMLHGGPLRIWSAITDPDHRRAWSPLVFLDNPCQLGETECTFAIQGITRPIRTPARVDQFDKPRAFAWSCGIPYLFTLEERYELAGDDGGTRLTHSCTLRGALSLPFAALMLRRLRSLMIEADARLATYLRWRVGQQDRRSEEHTTELQTLMRVIYPNLHTLSPLRAPPYMSISTRRAPRQGPASFLFCYLSRSGTS